MKWRTIILIGLLVITTIFGLGFWFGSKGRSPFEGIIKFDIQNNIGDSNTNNLFP